MDVRLVEDSMVPTPLQPYLGEGTDAALLLYGGLACVSLTLFLCLLGLWQLLGRGPRRRRAYQRARQLLQQGDWKQALEIGRSLKTPANLSRAWQGKLRNLEGEARHRAADEALREKRWEDALEHFHRSAECLNLDVQVLHERVIDAMLAEARRLVALECAGGSFGSSGDSASNLLARLLQLHTPCPEATFWLALCHLREGRTDAALQSLTKAHTLAGQRFIDPPLYLGALLLREGRPQEALRYLSEANRDAGNCPLVTLQLGMAMVAAGGDQKIAVKALDRAVGARGLGLWSGRKPASPQELTAQPVWVEGLPETRSFVRRLALKHPYRCPVMGGDLGAMIRQGQFTLAQAHYRLGNYQESADLFSRLLQDSPPTPALLRGLGVSLVRLEKHDLAYKHLRTALEAEEPKQPLTAAYLAVSAALGKPAQDDDKPRNVGWAIRLLARYPEPDNPEWAQLAGRVHAEARTLQMAVGEADQVLLCDALAFAGRADASAAAAFDHLAVEFPDAVRSDFAWLYCRAAHTEGYRGKKDLELFGRTFREESAARDFFARRKWDFEEVEYAYLDRWSAAHPATFPPEFGSGAAYRCVTRLMSRSLWLEEMNQPDDALACVTVLLRMTPDNTAALNRAAQLAWKRGDLDRAVLFLTSWHALEPRNVWPLVRRAIVEQQRRDSQAVAECLHKALDVTQGAERASVAFLGAQLALREAVNPSLHEAVRLLTECLRDDPDHIEALWRLAAVRAVLDDRAALAAQASTMHRPDVRDARFQYFAAYCHLLNRDATRALKAAESALANAGPDAVLAADAHYLAGRAQLELGQTDAALRTLSRVVETPGCPSADAAWALLGSLALKSDDSERAVQCWNRVDVTRRSAWKVDEALRGTVYLNGLRAYGRGEYESAAEKFREAGKLGLRERRLGGLISLALFKAGQRLLYGD